LAASPQELAALLAALLRVLEELSVELPRVSETVLAA